MAGSSCDGCTFQQFSDNTQVGCLLNRLDKYENVDILNQQKNGFYKVLPHNICAGYRDKAWLGKNPRRPDLAVRQELYPKVQLIVIIEQLDDLWVEFFRENDFTKYSAIDVLVFSGKDVFAKLGNLVNAKDFYLHTCYKPDATLSFADEVKHQINYIVREDCQFYLTINSNEYRNMNPWLDRADYYLNDLLKPVFLLHDDSRSPDESFMDGMLVYTPLHVSLGGFGSQNIIDKIIIHCTNHEQLAGVHNYVDFWAADLPGSTSDEVARENISGDIE